MTRRLGLALLVLGLSAASLRAQMPFDRNMIPTRTALERTGLERQWLGIVPLGAGYDRLLSISLAEDMLFAQTSAGNFHAYNAETGRYLWGLNIGPEAALAFGASVNSDRVLVTNLNVLYCLDRGTGQLIWKVKLDKMPTSGTAADEQNAVVGLSDGKVICFSIRDHTKDDPPGRSAGSMLWTWKTNGTVSSRPMMAGKVIVFASQDRRAYVITMREDAIRPATLLYRLRTGGPISASMAGYGTRTLLVPSEDGDLYAIDLFTSAMKWTYSTGSPILQEPLVAQGDIYLINKEGRVMAIDPENGNTKWSVPASPEAQVLTVGANRIYAMTADRTLVVADRATGKLLATGAQTFNQAGLNLTSYTVNLTNRHNDRIYLGSKSGVILCLREAGKLQPTLLRPADEKPFGYLDPNGSVTTPPASPAAPGANAGAPGVETDPFAAPPAANPPGTPAADDPFAAPPAARP